MKEIKLTTQLNVIFTIVTLLTSLVFVIALNRVFEDFRIVQNKEQLASYFQDVKQNINNPPANQYNGYVIYIDDVITKSSNLEVLDGYYTAQELIQELSVWPGYTKEE